MRTQIIAALALMAAAPAPALSYSDGSGDAEAIVKSIYDAGQCIVHRDRSAAIRILDALPVDSAGDPNAAARIVRDTGCMAAPLPSNFPLFLRGAIAQTLLQTDFVELRGEPHSIGRLVDFRLPVEADGEVHGEVAVRYRWSDCVARNDPSGVERLLRTTPGSDAERRLVRRMAPYLSACMDEQVQLSASSPEVRSLLVQSTYHMLFRYWHGHLRSAGFVTAENPEGRLLCRTYEMTGTRVKTERVCLSPRDWERVRLMTREQVAAFVLKAMDGRH